MRIKLYRIVTAIKAIEENRPKELPAVLSFKISRVLDALKEQFNQFETERIRLVNKYGIKDDKNISVPDESKGAFYNELNILLDLDVDISIPEISINDFSDVPISTTFTDGLSPFIK